MSSLALTNTDEQAASQGVKCAIYGIAGAGKTMLAATAPKPLIIQAENGSLSLSRHNIERVFGVDTPGISYSIPMIPVKTVSDFEAAYQYFFKPEVFHNFDTLYLDSGSEIVEAILKYELANNRDGRMAFGEMAERSIEIFKKFRDIPTKNVVITFKQGHSTDSDLMGPSMPGKQLDREIPYIFDEVLRMGIGEDPTTKQKFRYLQTQSDLKFYAKDRSGALDPRGEAPYLYAVFNKIKTGV